MPRSEAPKATGIVVGSEPDGTLVRFLHFRGIHNPPIAAPFEPDVGSQIP